MSVADKLHAALEKLTFKESGHDEAWRDEVGAELNTLIGRAIFDLETGPVDVDIEHAQAVLSLVRRVAEFGEIEEKE